MVQLSHQYMTTGKTIALTRRTFVDKVMSLLFNMLSRLVTAFLPKSKRLLIARLQSPSVVILEPKKIKLLTVSIVSPFICHEVMGLDAMLLVFWMSKKHSQNKTLCWYWTRYSHKCQKKGHGLSWQNTEVDDIAPDMLLSNTGSQKCYKCYPR